MIWYSTKNMIPTIYGWTVLNFLTEKIFYLSVSISKVYLQYIC